MNKKNTWKMLGAASALLLQLTLSTACTSSGNTNSQEAQTEVTQDEMQALATALPKYSNVDNFHDGLAAVCDRQTELMPTPNEEKPPRGGFSTSPLHFSLFSLLLQKPPGAFAPGGF
jgi:hypothetical protein